MKRIRSLFSVMLFLAILVTVLQVFAETPSGTFQGFKWSVDRDTLTIEGSGILNTTGPWTDYSKKIKILNFSGEDLIVDTGFDNFKNITELHIGTGVKRINKYSLQSIGKNVKIFIEGPDFEWVGGFIQNQRIANVILGDQVHNYIVENDFLMSEDRETLYSYFGKEKGTVVIPDTVKTIHMRALSSKNMNKIILPQELKTIQDGAFGFCTSLKEIVIPASVKTLGSGIINGCNKLTSINYLGKLGKMEYDEWPDHYSDLKSIKTLILPPCPDISEVVVSYCPSLDTLIIPEGVKKYSGYNGMIYQNKKLKAIYLPKSLTEISAHNLPYSKNIKLFVKAGSYAHDFAITNSYNYTIVEPIQSIELSEYNLEIKAGKTAKIKATIQPQEATSKTIQWISTDETIATVQNGSIKAIASGECDILCRGLDCDFTTAICHVTVQ